MSSTSARRVRFGGSGRGGSPFVRRKCTWSFGRRSVRARKNFCIRLLADFLSISTVGGSRQAYLAILSTSSFPSRPLWLGTYCMVHLVPVAVIESSCFQISFDAGSFCTYGPLRIVESRD